MNKKTWKVLGAGGLALFMGIGTLCGVLLAPMNAAQASVAGGDAVSSSNVGQGLITPKEDDPVLFTTESGLEIKWGNTLPSTYDKHLGSGNLTNFAYFTTNDGTKTYTWVIIGASDSLTLGNDYKYSQTSLLSDKNTTGIFKDYYDNNIFNNTPAGTAIDAEKSKQLILDSVVQASEIPDGCVLCLANDIIETGPQIYLARL